MVQDPAVDEELAYNNESRQAIIYQPRAMEPLDDIGQQFDNNNAGNSSSVVSLVHIIIVIISIIFYYY